MNSPSTQFITSGRMGMYEPIHHIGMWGDTSPASMIINGSPGTSTSMIFTVDTKLENQSENTSQDTLGPSSKYDQEASKPSDKVQRRQAQNREAARKSRLRKKAYVQQLESSRLKLIQLEQELERARQQGLYLGGGVEVGHLGFNGTINSAITTFEMEYGNWLEEQTRQISDLGIALNAHISDEQLQILVESSLNHYSKLFSMKAAAAEADVFYMISGMWKPPAERFLLWIGGFRPSDLLKVLLPQLEPLVEHQHLELTNLILSCQQAEDALSQGMDKLQQTVVETLAGGHFDESSYMPQLENAMEMLESLVRFVSQADHLRKETLLQMHRQLTIRQAARGLLVLGEYFQRFRDLSSLWTTRHHEPA
ncbi:hypothetical protein K2173_005299 [Erythroxylum novogranatense]|uniref:Uncharacterized protein n=1 Tax=Erythroxylum novogranatense TaxID=1862640 RepID=A0AAV8TT80_9ROSI|nr:hypothetical protein K2173_005299 [Erythroxylum novogranatense]